MRFTPPTPGERRVAVRVTTAAERHIRRGHPWVFDQSIESASHDAAPGDLAVVFDKRRDFVAIGLWDPESPIRLRVLHAGKPTTIDDNFWEQRVVDAVAVRQPLLADPATNAFRVLNGENDGFPALVADCYDTTLVVKVYSRVWLAHLQPIVDAIVDLLGIETVIVRVGRLIANRDLSGLVDGGALLGDAPVGPVRFLENGLAFDADVVAGQKTGHFLDQRDNRAMVGALADGADVLDVFSCTGGFSVHAAAGGARSVTSVDIAAPALESARHNMAINAHDPVVAACDHRVVRADAFAAMEAAIARGDRFDLVVVDPPSFASRQSAVGSALRAYGRLTRLAVSLVADGGTLVQASCSSRVSTDDFLAVVHGAAAEDGAELGDAIVTGHAIDHPVTFAEGGYLKAIFARPRRGSF